MQCIGLDSRILALLIYPSSPNLKVASSAPSGLVSLDSTTPLTRSSPKTTRIRQLLPNGLP